MKDKATLINEARYAERLCLRTARMYRRLQTSATFAAVVGGSATLSALSPQIPAVVSIVGSVVFAVFGAALVAIRPSEKITANEADAKRYAALRTAAIGQTAEEIAAALNKAHESGTAEVESLRMVAFNDVCEEVGRPEHAVKLTWGQKLLAAVA